MEEEEVQLLTPEPEQAEAPKPVHRWIVTGVFAVALCLVVGFSWKIFSFYQGIQSGEINPALAYTSSDSFTAAASTIARLAAQSPTSPLELATDDDPSLGPDDAKVTIVEFADFGCPYSKEVSYIIRAIAKQFPNDVRVVYRDYPLTDLHPGADLAARAAECADEQGKFWEYHDALYESTATIDEQHMKDLADDVGLDEKEFSTCLASEYYVDEVAEDFATGISAGVEGTPTFFFNGVKVEGSIPFSVFNEIIDALLEA